MDAVLSTSKLGLPFNTTDTYKIGHDKSMHSVCTFVRPLEATGISSLKIGDSITFLSGFNVYQNVSSVNRVAYGESNLKVYVMMQSTATFTGVVALAALITVF